MSDSKSGSEIPPLIPGTTNYPKWMENIPDLLITNKCGDVFIMPDPHKRAPFDGTTACTQVGHPLLGTVPPKETELANPTLPLMA